METKKWIDIPYSEKAKQILANLSIGTALAVRMRHVSSSDSKLPKVQIEFAEKINNTSVVVAASLLNAKDERFSSGAQRAWETADLSVAEQMFGKIPEGQASVEILQILEPKDGKQFRVQLTECTESELSDNERAYAENYLKRAGKEGNYFYTPSGERVASRKRLVIVNEGENPVNTYLEGSFKASGEALNQTMTGSKAALSPDMKGA